MGRRHTLLALLAVLGVLFLARADAKCFHIDGSATDNTFQPCDAGASASGCCASNKSRPDICLTSGLCYAQEFGFEGLIFSNGCTDKSGQAEGCPTVCPQGAVDSNGDAITAWNVLQCGVSGAYCCRAVSDSRNCCGNETAQVTIEVGALVLPTRTTTTTVGAGATETKTVGNDGATSTVTATVTVAPTGSASCPKDNTAVVGGAVGGALGAALLASAVTIALLLRRRQQPAPQYEQVPKYGAGMGQLSPGTTMVATPQELPTATGFYEMQGNQVR